jgi:hypothetical protein
MKTTFKLNMALAATLILGLAAGLNAQVVSDLQNYRSQGKDGINVFETPKTTEPAFEGLKIRFGGSNTLQFQAIDQENAAGAAAMFKLGPNFNLATSNLDMDVQLARGVRMHLRTYLSSRHHPEPYVKGGYMQIDRLDFIQEGFLDGLMDNVTIKVGHMQINYGDNHFRRSDNGQAMFNPFVGNYIMDSFTTEVGGEVYFQKSGFLAMAGVTNGKLNQSTVLAAPGGVNTKLSLVGKVGYDSQLSEDLRVRVTGSVYHTGQTASAYLYSGDRAGSRYYNVITSNAAEFRAPRFNPGFNNELTAIMINPFVKFQGLEFYGVLETSSGKARAEAERRTFNQYGAELLYRLGADERYYVGGRYNSVAGKVNTGQDVSITRMNIGGGWFLTNNILAKAEYVTQSYSDFATASIFDGAKMNGFVLEAIISF